MSTKKIGRPTKYCENTVKKLEEILKIGGTVEDACSYAEISRETYYSWLNEYDNFLTKMEAAKLYPDLKAKSVVVESIAKGKNLKAAMWWLERKRPNEFTINIPNSNAENRIESGISYSEIPEENRKILLSKIDKMLTIIEKNNNS